MELRVQQLGTHLQDTLLPIYIVSGDEPLQVEESLQLLRTSARENGYLDRHVFHVERSFDWNQLAEQTSNLSLFAEKKILELRIPSGKPGTTGTKTLQSYCEQVPDDILLLVQCGKLDKGALKTKWVQAISSIGGLIRAWPLQGAELTRWIQTRLRHEDLSDDRQSAEYIASRVEGNMLAAAQEIEKMALLQLGADKPNQSPIWMSNQSRYNVFDLVDTILQGNRGKSTRILKQMQDESFAPNLVLWALAELIRAVIYTSLKNRSGAKGVQNVFYYSKKDRLGSHAHKFHIDQLSSMLIKCAYIGSCHRKRVAWIY